MSVDHEYGTTQLPAEPTRVVSLGYVDQDLIVEISAGLTREQYDQLSAIAPTIVQPKGDIPYGTAWQDATRMVGKALGRAGRAERLVTDLEGRFAAARTANPQLAGRTRWSPGSPPAAGSGSPTARRTPAGGSSPRWG